MKSEYKTILKTHKPEITGEHGNGMTAWAEQRRWLRTIPPINIQSVEWKNEQNSVAFNAAERWSRYIYASSF